MTLEENDEWGHHAEVQEEDEMNTKPTASANELREMANGHYSNSDFDSALSLYTAALEAFEFENQSINIHVEKGKHNENNVDVNDYINLKVIYLCNRATCLFRMEMYEESRSDALEAVNVSNGKVIVFSLNLFFLENHAKKR